MKTLERHSETRAVIEDEMVTLLSGKVAEEIVFGDSTTGALSVRSKASTLWV